MGLLEEGKIAWLEEDSEERMPVVTELCTGRNNLPFPIHKHMQQTISAVGPIGHFSPVIRGSEMDSTTQVVVSLTAQQLTGNGALIMASALMMPWSISDR